MSATERLSTLDQFGSKKQVIPAEVTGRLRTWRTRVYCVLLPIFLLLPWIEINGLQAILLDIPGRRFEIFGVLFLSHDAPLVFFIIMLLALGLAIVTALFGRVWCGWACPQTVFIDAVYRRIEILVEGNYIERRKLQAQAMTFRKACKLTTKWVLFLLVSSIIAHSVIAYFVGSDRLLKMLQGPPSENWTYFLLVTTVTGLLLFNFGWFREQFCLIMCPYGRFQSVLMDQNTVTVMYDEKRTDDCVKCNRCVQVCPTGIDIRHGIQMECISCTACIDACNVIMRKVNKPEGLIRNKKISDEKNNVFHSRLLAYVGLAVILSGILAYSLAVRKPYSLVIHRAKDVPYQIMQDEKILNHFKVHFVNQTHSTQRFSINLNDEQKKSGILVTQIKESYEVLAADSLEAHFFIAFPKAMLSAKGEAQLKVLVLEEVSAQEQWIDLTVLGPYSSGS